MLLLALSGQGETQPHAAAPTQRTQQDQQTTDQAWPAPRAERPRAAAGAEQQQANPAVYKPDCAQPKDHDEADLCQQIRMAQAAEDAVYWARAQTVLGAVGFLAVLASLFFTGWAAIAAASAAKAAQASVDVASKTAERQLRAYVDVESGQILDFGKPGNLKLRLIVKNSGQTPAYNLSQWTAVGADDLPPKSGFVGPNLPVTHTSTLAPGSFQTVLQEYGPLSAEQIAKIENGRAAIWAWGRIDYTDAFGYRRKSLFRLRFTGNATTDPPGGMHVDEDGNDAD